MYVGGGGWSDAQALLRRGAARVEMSEEGSLEGAVQDIEAALEQEPVCASYHRI